MQFQCKKIALLFHKFEAVQKNKNLILQWQRPPPGRLIFLCVLQKNAMTRKKEHCWSTFCHAKCYLNNALWKLDCSGRQALQNLHVIAKNCNDTYEIQKPHYLGNSPQEFACTSDDFLLIFIARCELSRAHQDSQESKPIRTAPFLPLSAS